MRKALEDFELPDDVKLQPNKVYYRKGDHQLMTSAFVGEAQSKGKDDPEDLFQVDEVVAGRQDRASGQRNRLHGEVAVLV